MIALWMLYAVVIAAWIGLAALLLERALRGNGAGGRGVWLLAMLLSIAVPVIAAMHDGGAGGAGPAAGVTYTIAADWLAYVDLAVLLAWSVSAILLVIALLAAQLSLYRARRGWSSAELHGERVLITRDVGPGVALLLARTHIVLPGWTLEMGHEAQRLMIAHEREHVRARDQWLIVAGLSLLVLCPFNAVLWWQFRRLKLAVEMDCDARVLSGRQDVRAYAALLLDVGERRRAGHLVFAAFAAPPHAIERRIRTMLALKREPRRWLLAACAAGAVVIGVLACHTPEPMAPDLSMQHTVVPEKEMFDKLVATTANQDVGEKPDLHAVNYEGKAYVIDRKMRCTRVGPGFEECELPVDVKVIWDERPVDVTRGPPPSPPVRAR
jgi:bla regulator protein blaR1